MSLMRHHRERQARDRCQGKQLAPRQPRRRMWHQKGLLRREADESCDGPTRYERRGVPTVETRGLVARAILGASVHR